MTTSDPEPISEPFDDVLAEYMLRIDRGEQVDRERYVQEHPEVADQLREHFEDLDTIGHALGETDDAALTGAAEADFGLPREFGSYILLEKLGAGGMGDVYRAQHRAMERIVAIKIIRGKMLDSPHAVERFQREVKAVARLSHANIVPAYDAGEVDGISFLAMEYVDGQDLASLVRRHGPLPVEQAVDYVMQAARGLQHAHQAGIIHRDVKPSNLLVDAAGTVKIMDLGLARLASTVAEADDLTGAGQIMGTVDYMAPEQAVDTRHADARADIYSLGTTLWYLLADGPLYAGQTTVEKLLAHQTKPVPSLREACPEVSADLEAVFQRMVAKTPEERYQTMAEVIAALEPLTSRLGVALLGTPSSVRSGGDATPRLGVPSRATRSDSDGLEPGEGVSAPVGSAAFRRSEPAEAGTANRRNWRTLTAAGAGALLLICLGIWVVIRDKEGKEVARVQLPEGGSVTQEPGTSSPGPGAAEEVGPGRRTGPDGGEGPWNLPPEAPPPAIAPFDAAGAKAHQDAWAKYLGVSVEMENSLGIRFVLIPPGEFDMGSTEEQTEKAIAKLQEQIEGKGEWFVMHLRSEAPQHRVRITKPFYLGRYEVTQAEYERVVGTNPSQCTGDPMRPVETVSWRDASAFCTGLAKLPQERASRAEYRLPSEAEWEYACRAGTTTARYSGDDEAGLEDVGWYLPKSEWTPHPVGQKTPNAWGLHGTLGNVWEWCQDVYGAEYYTISPINDPTGPAEGGYRVCRGGGSKNLSSVCRAASRQKWPGRAPTIGFRIARPVSWPSPSR